MFFFFHLWHRSKVLPSFQKNNKASLFSHLSTAILVHFLSWPNRSAAFLLNSKVSAAMNLTMIINKTCQKTLASFYKSGSTHVHLPSGMQESMLCQHNSTPRASKRILPIFILACKCGCFKLISIIGYDFSTLSFFIVGTKKS